MHATYAQLVRAIESIEALVADDAFRGAAERLDVVEYALDSYLESSLRHPHVACEVSTEVLWRLFMRLRAAIEARSRDAVALAATDLKRELWVYRDAREPPSAAAH